MRHSYCFYTKSKRVPFVYSVVCLCLCLFLFLCLFLCLHFTSSASPCAQHLVSYSPLQSIVLLEDVDAAFPSREESAISADANSRSSDVTFSGLLNVLDGVSSRYRLMIDYIFDWVKGAVTAMLLDSSDKVEIE